MRYKIDDLVERTGFSRRRIRYYVAEGLLDPPAARGRGGFYFDSHLQRLLRIRSLIDDGLRLSTIREILARTQSGDQVSRESTITAQPVGERWVRFAPAPGLEIHVREDLERRLGDGLLKLLRHARSLTEGGDG